VTLEDAAGAGTVIRWRSEYDSAGLLTALVLRLAVRDSCKRLARAAPKGQDLAMGDEAASASLDGRLFRVAAMGAAGEASEATVFEYHERDGVVWARYEGGAVRLGFLVGTRDGDRLDFRYSQMNEHGETSNGRCSTTISTLPDGRLRLDEHWAWESKSGAGTSAAEEIARAR
jgi:hypothetical protein